MLYFLPCWSLELKLMTTLCKKKWWYENLLLMRNTHTHTKWIINLIYLWWKQIYNNKIIEDELIQKIGVDVKHKKSHIKHIKVYFIYFKNNLKLQKKRKILQKKRRFKLRVEISFSFIFYWIWQMKWICE